MGPLPPIIWKNLVRTPYRTTVLLVAVAALSALLAFALLFNHAVQSDLDTTTRKLGADIVMVPVEAMGPAQEFILESKEKTFYMDAAVFGKVKDLPEIEAATYQIYLNTLASGCCSIIDGQVVAIDQKTDFIVRPWLDHPPPLGRGEVYVGSYVYEYLGLIQTPSLFGRKVKVVAHLPPTGTGLDHALFMRVEDLDLVSEEARGAYRPGRISIVFLKVRKGYDVERVADKIQEITPTIGILTRGTLGGSIREILADIMGIFTVTIGCSTTLAVLLVWSAFTAISNERRREVGILRAIGARRRHIFLLFLGEAAVIGSVGGTVGVGAGVVLLRLVGGRFHVLANIGAMIGWSAATAAYAGVALACGILVCLLGALPPVWRLAHMEPMVAVHGIS